MSLAASWKAKLALERFPGVAIAPQLQQGQRFEGGVLDRRRADLVRQRLDRPDQVRLVEQAPGLLQRNWNTF